MATHHYDRPKTHPLRIFHRVGILVFIGLACLLIGCDGNLLEGISDDDSYEAKLEEGLMALDDEDYDKAVNRLRRIDRMPTGYGNAGMCAHRGAAPQDVANHGHGKRSERHSENS